MKLFSGHTDNKQKIFALGHFVKERLRNILAAGGMTVAHDTVQLLQQSTVSDSLKS